MKKNYKKLISKKKGDKLYVKWKCYKSSFNSWIEKKSQHNFIDYTYKMSQYFPRPYEPFARDINVKVDLSNYAAKQILKTFLKLILRILH